MNGSNAKLSISRDGHFIGEFSRAELELILKRPGAGVLLTDQVFDRQRNAWRRLSEVLTEPPFARPQSTWKDIILFYGAIAVAVLIICRLGLGSWEHVWELAKFMKP